MPRHTFLDSAHERAIGCDGYVVLDLLQDQDVRSLLSFYDLVEKDHIGDFAATALSDDLPCRRRVHDEIAGVFNRRLLPMLDDYRLVVATYVVKRAASEFSNVAVHQDFTFIEEDHQVGVSLWCPLVEVNAENGWLGVLPGSHLFNRDYREPYCTPYPDLIDVIEERYLKYLPMRAGQALFMDNRLFHASPRNRSGQRRVVAGGVAAPRGKPLLYCHRDIDKNDQVLEIYEVPEDFYLRHEIGGRPTEGRHLKTVPRCAGELTAERLSAHWQRLVEAA